MRIKASKPSILNPQPLNNSTCAGEPLTLELTETLNSERNGPLPPDPSAIPYVQGSR